MKPIIHVPNNVLTTPAKTVTQFDKRLHALIREMTAILKATRNPKGVGLAAPQVGIPMRIFLTRPREKDAVRAFINPEIVARSTEQTEGVPARPLTPERSDGGRERENKLEGCLSIPKIWGRVKRAATLTLRYQDEHGTNHEEEFSGFLATIIQHETDHTNGVLFTQRVLEQQGKLYQAAKDKEGKEVLEEITLQ